MADSFIQLPADSTGKKVDTRTESTNLEHREIHVVGDPASNEAVSVVTNIDPTGEMYGLVTRDPHSTTIASNTANIATLKFGTGYQDQALRVVTATDSVNSVNVVSSVGLSNTELRASSLDTIQVSGSINSTNVVTFNGNAPATGLNETVAGVLRVVQMSDTSSSVSATQAGTWNIGTVTTVTTVTGVTNSIASALVDSTGAQYSGSNPVPVNNVQWNGVAVSTGSGVSDTGTIRNMMATNSIMSTQTLTDAVANNDLPAIASFTMGHNGTTWDRAKLANLGSGEIQTTTLRTLQATDAVSSVQVSGISRTVNPTAVGDGSNVRASFDDLGRQLTRPIQVRDLIFTARLAKATGSTFGTETTLLSASAGFFNELIYLTATNDSNVAIAMDIRCTTAGNIAMSFTIPATGQIQFTPPVPVPQDATGNNWTVDLPDVTGTNVNVFGLFSREI